MDQRIEDLQQFGKHDKRLSFIKEIEESLEKERLSLYEEMKPTAKFFSNMTMYKRMNNWIMDNVQSKFYSAIEGLPGNEKVQELFDTNVGNRKLSIESHLGEDAILETSDHDVIRAKLRFVHQMKFYPEALIKQFEKEGITDEARDIIGHDASEELLNQTLSE